MISTSPNPSNKQKCDDEKTFVNISDALDNISALASKWKVEINAYADSVRERNGDGSSSFFSFFFDDPKQLLGRVKSFISGNAYDELNSIEQKLAELETRLKFIFCVGRGKSLVTMEIGKARHNLIELLIEEENNGTFQLKWANGRYKEENQNIKSVSTSISDWKKLSDESFDDINSDILVHV